MNPHIMRALAALEEASEHLRAAGGHDDADNQKLLAAVRNYYQGNADDFGAWLDFAVMCRLAAKQILGIDGANRNALASRLHALLDHEEAYTAILRAADPKDRSREDIARALAFQDDVTECIAMEPGPGLRARFHELVNAEDRLRTLLEARSRLPVIPDGSAS